LVNTPACHAGDREFESRRFRHFLWGVAKLAKAQDFDSCIPWFESRHPSQRAQIAQSVEQGTENPRVAGSIPALGTTIIMVA
jgi:hypothetical protein